MGFNNQTLHLFSIFFTSQTGEQTKRFEVVEPANIWLHNTAVPLTPSPFGRGLGWVQTGNIVYRIDRV
ncbi:MAG: hypothetical protein ABW170_20210, partial [Candidatus Thiodiazotropha sp. L084R]